MSASLPTLDAMLICDQILTDKGTHKRSLIGIFETIYASKFPCRHSQLSIYIKFTDALGKYRFKLDLYDLQEDRVMGVGELPEATIEDKLRCFEIAFNFHNITFPAEGKYEFRIYANDHFFGSKTFFLKKYEKKHTPKA